VVVSCVLMARDRFLAYNALRLAQPVLSLVLIASLWMAGALTPYTAAAAVLISYVPALFFALAELWSRPPASGGFVDASRRLLSYGIRAYGQDLVSTLADQMDRVLVVGLVNPAMMGLYVVGSNLAQALQVVPAATVTVLFPKAAGQSKDEAVALTGRAVRVTLAAMIGTAAAAALAGPLVIGLFYGQEFLGAVPVLRVLLADVLLRGVVRVLAQAFMASGRPGLVSIVQGMAIGVSIPLVLLLVPRYGLVGAGLGMAIASAFHLVVILACFPLVLGHAVPRLRITIDEAVALLRRR
jgi:O-antigen/teichoic acid export membrane protein